MYVFVLKSEQLFTLFWSWYSSTCFAMWVCSSAGRVGPMCFAVTCGAVVLEWWTGGSLAACHFISETVPLLVHICFLSPFPHLSVCLSVSSLTRLRVSCLCFVALLCSLNPSPPLLCCLSLNCHHFLPLSIFVSLRAFFFFLSVRSFGTFYDMTEMPLLHVMCLGIFCSLQNGKEGNGGITFVLYCRQFCLSTHLSFFLPQVWFDL